MAFLNDWYSGREMNEGLLEEKAAIEKVLAHWDELPVYGGILHEHGRILGLTYGARSASDILAVHIEKATRDVPGAYPALSQAFAKSLPSVLSTSTAKKIWDSRSQKKPNKIGTLSRN